MLTVSITPPLRVWLRRSLHSVKCDQSLSKERPEEKKNPASLLREISVTSSTDGKVLPPQTLIKN